MHSTFLMVLIFACFAKNFVDGLKCKCGTSANANLAEPRGWSSTPCAQDGTCSIDNGACVITESLGVSFQMCAPSPEPYVGCTKLSAKNVTLMSALTTPNATTCLCNDKDYCNDKITKVDFGVRVSGTIKCKCSPNTNGCDSSGSCSTDGICYAVVQSGITKKECRNEGGPVGCTNLTISGRQVAFACGCENRDYCNDIGGTANQNFQKFWIVASLPFFLAFFFF